MGVAMEDGVEEEEEEEEEEDRGGEEAEGGECADVRRAAVGGGGGSAADDGERHAAGSSMVSGVQGISYQPPIVGVAPGAVPHPSPRTAACVRAEPCSVLEMNMPGSKICLRVYSSSTSGFSVLLKL